jgi:23S rRNA (uracil1939-C5)-methyltransferase
VGLFGEKSHKVVPIAGECRLFHPKIIKLLKAVEAELIRAGRPALFRALRHIAIRINGAGDELLLTFIMRRREELAAASLAELMAPLKQKVPQLSGITLNINAHEGGEVFGPREELLAGKSAISHTFMGQKFALSSRSFFQNNYAMAEKMFSSLKSLLPKVPLLIDAYAGVGVIGSILADIAEEVISIEENAAAVADGRVAVTNNNLAAKQHFICGKSEVEIPKMDIPSGALLLVDPPRGGVDKALWESIAATSLAKIAYISCNPGTLARDLKILQAMGFRLKHISAYDLFPETVHIETVALLSKRS